MIYFDVREALKFLSLEDKGRLLDGILEYGEFGTDPGFESGLLVVTWAFMKPKLDADAERYDNTIAQRKYAVAAREAKKNGEALPPFEEWKAVQDIGQHHPTSTDTGSYPTTTTTATATTSSTPTTTTTTATTTATTTGESASSSPPSGLNGVVEYFVEHGGSRPAPETLKELNGYISVMGADVCRMAIDAAIDSGVKRWSYITQVLKNKRDQGVKSVSDWYQVELNRKKTGRNNSTDYWSR